jgi:hypothetical protein
MKKQLPYLFILILLVGISCSKNSPAPVNIAKPPFIKDTSDKLLFRLFPVAINDVKISFNYSQSRGLSKLILKKDTTVLATYTLGSSDFGSYSTEIFYNFDSTKQYTIQVQANAVSDTILQYTLPPYTPVYRSGFQYQKILSLQQSLGFNGFDISPSRNYLFIADYSSNKYLTKRINLQNYAVDTISSSLISFPVRAYSDSELLVQYGSYQNRVLGFDSLALMNYNIRTTQTKFIDWTSENYGRTSRVKNNHIMITAPNPIANGGFTSLNNLVDGSKIVYGPSQVNYTQIREGNFEAIYSNNQLVNPLTGSFTSLLPANVVEGIEYYDSSSQYTISSHYIGDNVSSSSIIYSGYFAVYSNQVKVYQSDFVNRGVFYIPRAQQIKNNTMLYFKSFDYDTTFHTDGYYSLNLTTKTASLVQCDNSYPYYINDFLFDDAHIISVRNDGVYLLIKR